MKNKGIVRKETTLFDTVYRLKNTSVKELTQKYPDRVVEATIENGKVVLWLDSMRLKYVNS